MPNYYCNKCLKLISKHQIKDGKCTQCGSQIKYIGNCGQCLNFIEYYSGYGTCDLKSKVKSSDNGCLKFK